MKLPIPIPDGRRHDLACLGRLAVDLYAEQVGSRLEDVATFAKYLGGSSANIAFGAARLGLRSAMISRVGDEQMGRFLLESLQREGCDTSQVQVDPERLTGLVLLGLKDRDTFPLLFYRENCADMALDAEAIDAGFIAECRALLVTGTHLSQPGVRAASIAALAHARRHGTLRVLDIDYRPVLWGLTGRGEGANRYVADAGVTERLQQVLAEFDLLIGTEEEFLIAGGGRPGELLGALHAVRAVTPAALVVKLGPQGCCFIPGAIPERLADAQTASGERVEVLNVLGAGDAFAAGFLTGILRGQGFSEAAGLANACGAIVVSRHGCAPAMPTPAELAHWFAGSRHPRVDHDPFFAHLHRVTAARPAWPELNVLAFDHRSQFLDLARQAAADPARLAPLKRLLLWAAERVEKRCGLQGRIGVLVDDQHGADALHAATGRGWWVGRPIELPGSRPLRYDQTLSVGSTLATWPREQTVKSLVFYHPDDPIDLRLEQEARLLELAQATGATGHDWLLELIVPGVPGVPQTDASAAGTTATAGPSAAAGATAALAGCQEQDDRAAMADELVLRSVQRLYNIGLRPDWWKLAPMRTEGWQALSELVLGRDPHCRGAVILGASQPLETLQTAFEATASVPFVKGFMVGRSIWAEPALRWLSGTLSDEALVDEVAARFSTLVAAWARMRPKRSPAAGRLPGASSQAPALGTDDPGVQGGADASSDRRAGAPASSAGAAPAPEASPPTPRAGATEAAGNATSAVRARPNLGDPGSASPAAMTDEPKGTGSVLPVCGSISSAQGHPT